MVLPPSADIIGSTKERINRCVSVLLRPLIFLCYLLGCYRLPVLGETLHTVSLTELSIRLLSIKIQLTLD